MTLTICNCIIFILLKLSILSRGNIKNYMYITESPSARRRAYAGLLARRACHQMFNGLELSRVQRSLTRLAMVAIGHGLVRGAYNNYGT